MKTYSLLSNVRKRKSCRLCLKMICVGPVYSILWERILEMMHYVIDIQASQGDGLTSYVCEICYKTMKEFEIFKRNCHRVQTLLRTMNGDIKQTLQSFSQNNISENPYVDAIVSLAPENLITLSGVDLVSPITYEVSCVSKENEDDQLGRLPQKESFLDCKRPADYNGTASTFINMVSYREEDIETLLQIKNDSSIVSEISAADMKIERINNVDNAGSCGKVKPTGLVNVVAISKPCKKIRPLPSIPIVKAVTHNSELSKVVATSSQQQNLTIETTPETYPTLIQKHNIKEQCMESHTYRIQLHNHSSQYGYAAHHKKDKSLLLQKHFSSAIHCIMCEKSFESRDSVKKHMISHKTPVKSKAFPCPVCNKYFSFRGSLKRHSVLHTGERKYVCTKCGKSFNQAALLRRHTFTHDGVQKPYTCFFCSKDFGQKQYLRNHIYRHHLKIHLTFSCKICGRKFSHCSGLSRHNKNAHTNAIDVYFCSYCKKASFKNESTYRKHVQDYHQEEAK